MPPCPFPHMVTKRKSVNCPVKSVFQGVQKVSNKVVNGKISSDLEHSQLLWINRICCTIPMWELTSYKLAVKLRDLL